MSSRDSAPVTYSIFARGSSSPVSVASTKYGAWSTSGTCSRFQTSMLVIRSPSVSATLAR